MLIVIEKQQFARINIHKQNMQSSHVKMKYCIYFACENFWLLITIYIYILYNVCIGNLFQ